MVRWRAVTDDRWDLVVIGGGVLGLMTAARARLDHPKWTVRVVERGRVGQGATAHSAGLSFPIARDPWQASLVRASDVGYRQLVAELPGLPVRDIDVLWVLARDQVPALAGRLVSAAVPAGAEQVRALRDTYQDFVLRPDEVVMTTTERCFYTYGAEIAERLARWLRSTDPGAVWEGVGAARTEQRGAGWEVVLDDGRVLSARRVVVAVGPWPSTELEPDTGYSSRLRVKKVAALHLAHQPPPDMPCVVLWDDDAFVLPLHERGYCLFSYRNTTWDVDPDARIPLTPDDVADALAVLAPRSAELAARYSGGRVFCDGYTEDFVPLLRHRDGLVAMGGCSGSGVRLAPGLAAAALDLVRTR